MDLLNAFSRIVPFAFASGVNLYATVAIVGLSSRFGLVTLPEQFRAFENPWIIGVALGMYLIEFVVDKVPWLDSAWDAVHTVVRPIGGALVAINHTIHAADWRIRFGTDGRSRRANTGRRVARSV